MAINDAKKVKHNRNGGDQRTAQVQNTEDNPVKNGRAIFKQNAAHILMTSASNTGAYDRKMC